MARVHTMVIERTTVVTAAKTSWIIETIAMDDRGSIGKNTTHHRDHLDHLSMEIAGSRD